MTKQLPSVAIVTFSWVALISAAYANEEQFSACRVEAMAGWLTQSCRANGVGPDAVELSTKLARFVAPTGTETDCIKGADDAKADINRLLAKGGRKLACPFYIMYFKTVTGGN